MSYIRLEKDADGIVELIFDQPGKEVNVMGDEYAEAMPAALDELEAMKEDIKGVYVRSGKPGQFFAGGDITMMMEMDLNPSDEERQAMFEGILEAKEPLARLERLHPGHEAVADQLAVEELIRAAKVHPHGARRNHRARHWRAG